MSEAARSLPAGEQVGNYKILGLVGAGGMGVVYRALDLRLDRTVALKFLPHALNVGESEKQRFLQEAKTASALDHTNIGVIHGLEKTPDDQLFIVMAYYEGQTLAQKIRGGPLAVSAAVEIVMQVASGLAEAHARNIVHRDIKPSNIILTTQGVAKIVDFGLARVVSSASATLSVGVTGTLAYMSPEQARSEAVDQRTDIWSLGVVLAESLTGRHPFQRETLPNVVLAILEAQPGPLEGIPPALQEIIYGMLAKDPANRYASCRELLADLQRLKQEDVAATATLPSKEFKKRVEHASASRRSAQALLRRRRKGWLAAVPAALLLAALFLAPSVRERAASLLSTQGEKHIAVLPFESIGNNPADEVLAQGLMDSLTSKLSNLDVGQRSLWVVPASEVRRRKIGDPSAALRELGATLVVKGSIQRDAHGVRLTINLIKARDLRQIGSVALQERAGDLATLQDEAVARLARLMNIHVTSEMFRATGGSVIPAAYESYLKALGYMQRYDKAGNLDAAISALQGAVGTDPRFALGFGGLGEAYRLKFQQDQNPKWIEEASANCKRAVELDDRLASVYVTLGRVHDSTGQHDLALQEFQHALELDPRNADALHGLAQAYENAGRMSDAEATFKRSAALRPDYWDGYNTLGLFYDRQRRYADAAAQLRRAIELTPDNATAYFNLGAVLIHTGDAGKLGEAESILKKSIELNPSYPAYANLGYLYLQEKKYADSISATEKALTLNDKNYVVWSNLTTAYQWLNEKEKAAAARERQLPLLIAAAERNPRNARMQVLLGVLYAEKKQRTQALARVQAALALLPDDPFILQLAGEACDDLGDRQEALRYLQKAMQKGATLEDLRRNPALRSILSDPSFRSTGKQ